MLRIVLVQGDITEQARDAQFICRLAPPTTVEVLDKIGTLVSPGDG